mmetsp:Transcript_58412/g.166109  ORF Transcript_58412/g.166109 Transcript_58412/m.166109 type:complete len:215 (+) Transcript_58412:387-1031(+)
MLCWASLDTTPCSTTCGLRKARSCVASRIQSEGASAQRRTILSILSPASVSLLPGWQRSSTNERTRARTRLAGSAPRPSSSSSAARQSCSKSRCALERRTLKASLSVSKKARCVSSPTTLLISLKSTRAGPDTCLKSSVSLPRMKPKSMWKKVPSSVTITLSPWRSPRPRRKDMANQNAEETPYARASRRIGRAGFFLWTPQRKSSTGRTLLRV